MPLRTKVGAMVRRVFFSFHYQADLWRANEVRNSWVTQERIAAGFFDASLWEKAKKTGDGAIKRMIDRALRGTSVTVVLIGSQTFMRRYVRYEIEESIERGNGLLGVRIHKLKNADGYSSLWGVSPLQRGYALYDWVADDGYRNFGRWVNKAAREAGK